MKETDGRCEWLEDLVRDESRCVRKGRFTSLASSTSAVKVIVKYHVAIFYFYNYYNYIVMSRDISIHLSTTRLQEIFRIVLYHAINAKAVHRAWETQGNVYGVKNHKSVSYSLFTQANICMEDAINGSTKIDLLPLP